MASSAITLPLGTYYVDAEAQDYGGSKDEMGKSCHKATTGIIILINKSTLILREILHLSFRDLVKILM